MIKNLFSNPKYYKVLSIVSIVSIILSLVSFILLMNDLIIVVGFVFLWLSLIAMLISGFLFFASMIIQKTTKTCRFLFLSILIISVFSLCIYVHIYEIDRYLLDGYITKNILTYDLNVDEVKFGPSLTHKIYEWSSMFLIFGLPLFTWIFTAISILFKSITDKLTNLINIDR